MRDEKLSSLFLYFQYNWSNIYQYSHHSIMVRSICFNLNQGRNACGVNMSIETRPKCTAPLNFVINSHHKCWGWGVFLYNVRHLPSLIFLLANAHCYHPIRGFFLIFKNNLQIFFHSIFKVFLNVIFNIHWCHFLI